MLWPKPNPRPRPAYWFWIIKYKTFVVAIAICFKDHWLLLQWDDKQLDQDVEVESDVDQHGDLHQDLDQHTDFGCLNPKHLLLLKLFALKIID